MYCPKCGIANEEGMNFCARCGSPLGQPQQPQMMMPPPQRTDQKKMMLIIVTIIVAVVVVVAVIAAILLMSPGSSSNLAITHFDHIDALGIVTFLVDVSNTGLSTQSGTIVCTVNWADGYSYSNSQEITLNGGQSSTFTVVVTPGLTHMMLSPSGWSATLG